MAEEPKPVNEGDLKELKDRMNLIVSADPAQYHNDFSLKRYLRAFKTVDQAFQVILILTDAQYPNLFCHQICRY